MRRRRHNINPFHLISLEGMKLDGRRGKGEREKEKEKERGGEGERERRERREGRRERERERERETSSIFPVVVLMGIILTL